MSTTPESSVPTPTPTPPPARHKSAVHEITFISYPKLLFTWPLLLAGFVFYLLAPISDPAVLGWAYLTIVMLVILTLGVDLDRNQSIFWLVLVAGLWVLGLWLQDAKSVPVFSAVFGWFRGLDVKYDRGLGLTLSILLAIPFAIMLVYARFNDRWRITHNEFEHYSFGRMDDSLGRGAKTIRTSFPDMLELLLGLAGTLVVYNATGTRELRRIPHVMFLPLVRKRLNKILERTAITTDMLSDEEDDDEV